MLVVNHLPKTGGSSLTWYLEQVCEKFDIRKGVQLHGFPHGNHVRCMKSLRKIIDQDPPYIIGHIPMGLTEVFLESYGVTPRTITFLREPEKRMRSHLSYMLAHEAIIFRDNEFYDISHPWIPLKNLMRDYQFKWITSFWSGVDDGCSDRSFWVPGLDISVLRMSIDPFSSVDDPWLDLFGESSEMQGCLLADHHLIKDFLTEFVLAHSSNATRNDVEKFVLDLCGKRLNQTRSYAAEGFDHLVSDDFSPGSIGASNCSPHFEWLKKSDNQALISSLFKDLVSRPGHADKYIWDFVIESSSSRCSVFDWQSMLT